MLKGFTEKGDLKNVRVTEEGELMTKQSGWGEGIAINNTDKNPVPVKEIKENETTLNASVLTVGTEASVVEVNKKVTEIEVANYSETANVTMIVGTLNAVIGANIATSFPIGKDIENISLQSAEEETKVQIVIKGVE